MSSTMNRFTTTKFRRSVGLIFAVTGFIVFILGAQPSLVGLDRSPITGFVQILVFLIGLAVMSLGGYWAIASLWNGYQKTILADIGQRLVSTGLVIAVGSAMADIFGFGSQTRPLIPSFGDWQKLGVMVGLGVIGLGFLLLLPFGQDHSKD